MEKNGWKTAAKKPVKNIDLWKELDDLVENHSLIGNGLKGTLEIQGMKEQINLPIKE